MWVQESLYKARLPLGNWGMTKNCRKGVFGTLDEGKEGSGGGALLCVFCLTDSDQPLQWLQRRDDYFMQNPF